MELTCSTTLRIALNRRIAQLGESTTGSFRRRTMLSDTVIRDYTNTRCATDVKLKGLFEFLPHANLVLVVNGNKCHNCDDLKPFTEMLQEKLYYEFFNLKGDFLQFYTGATPLHEDYNHLSYRQTQFLNSQTGPFDILAEICSKKGFDYELRLINMYGTKPFDSSVLTLKECFR